MKNKKLFAILTLVCFMFTLMPVAAFAADPYVWVEEDAEVVKLDAATGGKADVRFQLSGTGSEIYVFAMKGGVLSEKVFAGTQKGFIKLNANPVSDAMTLTFTEQGEYTVYVVNADAYAKGVVAEATANNSGTAAKSLTQAANELLANSDNKAVMENNVITVNPYATSYALSASINGSTFYAEGTEDYKNIVEAALNPSSNGADEKTVWVKLTNNNVGVSGQDLTVTTNSYGIETSRETVTTNPNGVAKFKVSSTIAGDFKVYVEYGAKADLTLNVESDATAAAYITTVYAPTAPVALDTAIHDSEIAFTISDINGNNVDTLAKVDNNGDANYTVKLVESPKGTSIKATNLALGYDADSATWYLQGADLDAEGTYTFKVVLANGHSATATIAVKEFQTPVELKMVYKQNAVELDGTALLHKLFYVDANGVTKSLITKENSVFKNDKGETIKVNGVKNVKLAANG